MFFDRLHWDSNILATDGPDFDWVKYFREVPRVADYDLKAKMEEWHEVGVVTFEDCIPHSIIDGFLEDISFLCANRKDYSVEVEHKGGRYPINELPIDPFTDTGIKFNCLENVSLAARALSLNALVCDFLGHVFQDSPALIQSLTFWRGSEQAAHLDYPWVRVQNKLPHLAASWVPLEDIHEDAGPLAYYAGSHKHGAIPPFDWGGGSLTQEVNSERTPNDFVAYLAEQIDRNNFQKKLFLPRKGDALIWHGNLLHEGTKVKDQNRTRRSYVSHYTSLSAYPVDHRYVDAFEAKRYTRFSNGYSFDHPWSSGTKLLPSWRSLSV